MTRSRVFVRLTVLWMLYFFLTWMTASGGANEGTNDALNDTTPSSIVWVPNDTVSSDLSENGIPEPVFTQLEEQEKDEGYQESKARRFEIIFFISLPASAIISVLGVMAFKSASGNMAGFSSAEYGYIALSSIGISLSIAIRDSRKVYRKSPFEQH